MSDRSFRTKKLRKMKAGPSKNCEAALEHAATQNAKQLADDNTARGLAQAEAAIAELRASGAMFAVFALTFDEEREKLREQIEALPREKAFERRAFRSRSAQTH